MRSRAGNVRRRGGIVFTAVSGAVLLVLGGGIAVGALFAPQSIERAYGETKTTLSGIVDDVREEAFDTFPSIRLGASGDVAELDRCDGTFTEMVSYEHEDVPPVWAAHNNCSGDVLLAWEPGQRIRIAGDDQVYEVVDVRNTPKVWATIDDLVGIEGSFALQTCYYGEDRMKFIGLDPVDQNP